MNGNVARKRFDSAALLGQNLTATIPPLEFSSPRGWASTLLRKPEVQTSGMSPAQQSSFIDATLGAVCNAFAISRDELRNASRANDGFVPRFVAAYLLRDSAGLSLPRIAQLLNYDDHTTVSYVQKRISDLMGKDPALKQVVTSLRDEVTAMLVDSFVPEQMNMLHPTSQRQAPAQVTEEQTKAFGPTRPSYFGRNVKHAVCNAFGITEAKLLSASRDRSAVLPRWVAMQVMRTESDMSLPQIALQLGLKDHTTVMYGLQRLNDRLAFDETLRTLTSEIAKTAAAMPAPTLGGPRL